MRSIELLASKEVEQQALFRNRLKQNEEYLKQIKSKKQLADQAQQHNIKSPNESLKMSKQKFLFLDPRKSQVKQSRYESAEKEAPRKTNLILDNQAMQAQVQIKQFRQIDTSKESIRYSRFDNTSLAHDSSIQIVTQSRCS